MENEVKTWHILVFTAMIAAMIYMIYDKPQIADDGLKTNCVEDSLINVIHNLEIQVEEARKENDQARNKYEDILFEYNYGLERLKNYDINAYREFHRTIALTERFSTESEIENKKRLKID